MPSLDLSLTPFARAPDTGESFAIDPADLEPLLRREADRGLPVLGVYHSHPTTSQCLRLGIWTWPGPATGTS